VEGGEDEGLTGGGAASLASIIIRLKSPSLVEDTVLGLNKATRWVMDKEINPGLLGVADECADE